MIANGPAMTDGERHVLLASSGELTWAGRLRLRRVLARDEAAQRLAETLTLVQLVQAGPGAERSHRRPALRFAAALAATMIVAAAAWHWWPGAPHQEDAGAALVAGPDRAGVPTPLPEPMSASSSRLLLACRLATRPPAVSGRTRALLSQRSPRTFRTLTDWKLNIVQHAHLASPLLDPSR